MTKTAARDAVLAAVRAGVATVRGAADRQPAESAPSALPGTAAPDLRRRLLDRFCARAAEENATSERVGALDDVAPAIARYLADNHLAPQVLVTGNGMPAAMAHAAEAGLQLLTRPIRPDGDTLVTGSFAGIADSGAVVTLSGADCPNEWQFLAETHIVIIRADRLVADHDAFWQFLSVARPAGLPRALNWIVGPSRTADLGVPSRLGAHGPARVHLIIVAEQAGQQPPERG